MPDQPRTDVQQAMREAAPRLAELTTEVVFGDERGPGDGKPDGTVCDARG